MFSFANANAKLKKISNTYYYRNRSLFIPNVKLFSQNITPYLIDFPKKIDSSMSYSCLPFSFPPSLSLLNYKKDQYNKNYFQNKNKNKQQRCNGNVSIRENPTSFTIIFTTTIFVGWIICLIRRKLIAYKFSLDSI
jgi:hypothetical protein